MHSPKATQILPVLASMVALALPAPSHAAEKRTWRYTLSRATVPRAITR